MLTLLGSREKVKQLEEMVAAKLGFIRTLRATGQIYPRSLDYSLISKLSVLSAAPVNFSNTMRLMAREGLVNEGFQEGQVGSTAMPHKINSRSSERIKAFGYLLAMHTDGASRISGDTNGKKEMFLIQPYEEKLYLILFMLWMVYVKPH